jgi:hypothetical protein
MPSPHRSSRSLSQTIKLSLRRPTWACFQIIKILVPLAILYLVSYSFFQARHPTTLASDVNTAWAPPYSKASSHDRKIANGTLGFESIIVLGLPDRLLKRDSMELGASITGLNLTWEDGVLGQNMHTSSIPPLHDEPGPGIFKKDAEIGKTHLQISYSLSG